ncbi:MAG TPA: UPF0280 family protein [bacterium]|nr:UPF0280 family protein [bacterium]
MSLYDNRTYRNFASTATVAFRITVAQSDLFIRADRDRSAEAERALLTARHQIETYIAQHPEFATALVPLPADPFAPLLVKAMLKAGRAAGVGPMAAVAGATAEAVGQALAGESTQVIVENGGDCWLHLADDLTVGLVAGDSPFSGRIGLKITATQTPGALCTSSGTVGHSYSEGRADAVTVYARDAALADAAATAVANRVRSAADVDAALAFAQTIAGVAGVCIVIHDKLGIWGDLSLVKLP